MLREDRLSRATRDANILRRKALDRELFVACCSLGPLDGVLYATSELPGLLYEKIVSDAAIVVARWWRAIWPQRAIVKHKASTFIQTMFRGSRGRRRVTSERNTRRAISFV